MNRISCRISPLMVTLLAVALVVLARPGRGETGYAQSFTDGSSTNLNTDLIIGTNGVNNTLLISNGSDVTNNIGNIGSMSTANDNHGTVTGSGSVWYNIGTPTGYSFFVGNQGSSNTLVVSNGGVLNGGGRVGIVGFQTTAIGNALTITGNGSALLNTPVIRVGGDVGGGSSNLLMITDGGTATAGLDIGWAGNAFGNQVVVNGANSLFTTSPQIGVGGDNNRMIVQNGGKLLSTQTQLGVGAGSSGNQMVVTGSGSTWTNTILALMVGLSGSNNSLIISNGASGYISSSSSGFNYVGANAGSTNNYVRVVGANSELVSTFALHIGESGSSNALFIADGGTVKMQNLNASVNYGLVVGNQSGSANNLVQIDGGTLLATNLLATSSPAVDIRRGALVMNSGTIVSELLLATNGVSSVVNFNGGTIISESTTINNGSAFTIGNGGSITATYLAKGGTHTFTGGAVISADGVLSGTGTVVGVVNSGGTIAPGFTTGRLDVTGNVTNSNASILALQLGGTGQGTTYDWLNVAGTGVLDGELDVALFGGFQPSIANSFTVMTATVRSGVFDNAPVSGERYSFEAGWFTVNYDAQNVILSNFMIPEPSTILLLASGGAILWRRARRR